MEKRIAIVFLDVIREIYKMRGGKVVNSNLWKTIFVTFVMGVNLFFRKQIEYDTVGGKVFRRRMSCTRNRRWAWAVKTDS